MESYVGYSIEDGIAVVTLDAPQSRVNILNADFLSDLEDKARQLSGESGVKAAVVLSAKEKGFIAGADIQQIKGVRDPGDGAELARRGQRVLGMWAELPFPVVAAVHGHCMGGGTEFILACHYRIAAENASIALPEVKLGIFPGFGGTQRLPRLIALEKALDIILTGRSQNADRALKAGLVDEKVTVEQLRAKAIEMAGRAAEDPDPILKERHGRTGGLRPWLLERNPVGRKVVFHQARKNVEEKTGGHYPAPLKAIDVIEKGLELALDEGLELEARGLGEMIVTPVCKNLIHVYELSQRAKKSPGVQADPHPVERSAVLGAGVMGRGIAYLFADNAMPVLLKDVEVRAVDKARDELRRTFSRKLAKRHEPAEKVEEKMSYISGTVEREGLSRVDLVVEAVLEKMEVKKKVLAETEEVLPQQAVFATNTSALSVSELQNGAQRPERVAGLHFFNPAEKMPLVEVISGERTSQETLATLFSAALKIGKTPILVADRPGFLVNRILMAYLNEACLIAAEGVDWHSLDVRATTFGLPMGPFRLLDEVGMDIAAEVGETLSEAFGYIPDSGLLQKAVSEKALGRKNSRGFYTYQEGKAAGRNEALIAKLGLESKRISERKDLARMLYLMINEAGRCLDENVVQAPEDIDTGMVFGTGFPPFRGGPCRWADSQALPKVREELKKLADRHGERFSPCTFLKENDSFY